MANTAKLDSDLIFKIAALRRHRRRAAPEGHGRSEDQGHDRAQHGAGAGLGVRGTPAFVIGKQFVPGAVDAHALKELIADARKGA